MAPLVITPEIEADAQRLAEATGQTPTQAVADALQLQLKTVRLKKVETPEEWEARWKRAEETLRRLQALPWDKSKTPDELIGYDEFGLPTG